MSVDWDEIEQLVRPPAPPPDAFTARDLADQLSDTNYDQALKMCQRAVEDGKLETVKINGARYFYEPA
jgi:hypothetical protein